MNFKNKLLLLLFLTIFSIPISINAYSNNIILGGDNIGIEIKSKGVLVVGFYNVGKSSPGKSAGLQKGDVITGVDDTVINSITDLSDVMDSSKSVLKITYIRNDKEYETIIKLVKEEEIYKTGLYIKDKIIGIGTLTFIDPDSKIFASLGHEIVDSSTGLKFEMKDGSIFKSEITGIEKSSRNNPGEKNATYHVEEKYGTITKNKINGIYGKYEKSIEGKDTIEVANKNEVKTGKAYFRTVLKDNVVEEFEINILKVNDNDSTKNILFEVTDKKLISKTNGIVQGMSGSPIIQNNKIIGAVTHVLTDNPKRGYGIFITNMLEEADKQG
jgi:stage IV sporulation protein B